MILSLRRKSPDWRRCTALFLLVSMVSLVSGCGSDSNSVSAGAPSSGSGTTTGFFLGRLLLDKFLQGAQVTVKGLDGATLYTATTDHLGLFHATGSLPADFTIEARVAGDPLVYKREVRGGYDHLTMYVTPLSTLVSQYMTSSGASLADAEAAVRYHFFLPPNYNLDFVTNAQRSPFSPARYQQLAAQSGDPSAYYAQEVVKIGQDVSPRVLVLADLTTTSSAALDLAKTVAGDVLGDAVSVVDAGIFGAATQALGLNIGTTGALKAISAQLDAVAQQITALASEVATDSANDNYSLDLAAVSGSLANIETNNKIIDQAINGTYSISDLTTNVLSYTLDTDVNILKNYYVGQNTFNSIILDYNNKRTSDDWALTDASTYLNYPLRVNAQTKKLEKALAYYLAHLGLAANLYAENAHLQIPVAPSLLTANQSIGSLAKYTQWTRAQVPDQFTTDSVLCDLPNGLMWYAAFFEQTDYNTAMNVAAGLQEGGFTQFRLASRDELENFIQNRVALKVPNQSDNNSTADTQWIAAFNAMGIDTTNYKQNTYKNFSILVGGNTNPQGQSYFDLDTDTGYNNENVYQWWGVGGVPATTFYSPYTNDYTYGSETAYLLVRTYAGQSEIDGDGNVFAYGQLNSSSLTVTASGTQLNATTLFDAKGITPPAQDVTTRCYWESSDESIASVSSLNGQDLETGAAGQAPANPPNTYPGPGGCGNITWHPSLHATDGTIPKVTFTGTFWGGQKGGTSGLATATGSITLSMPSSVGQPVFTSAQVLPYNNSVDLSTAPSEGVSILYYATSFYLDGQLFQPADSAPTYKLYNSANQLINSADSGGGFISTKTNELILYSSLPAGNYTVNATYTSPEGQTSNHVQINQSVTGSAPLHIDNLK